IQKRQVELRAWLSRNSQLMCVPDYADYFEDRAPAVVSQNAPADRVFRAEQEAGRSIPDQRRNRRARIVGGLEVAAREQWNPHDTPIARIHMSSQRFAIPGVSAVFSPQLVGEKDGLQRGVIRRAGMRHARHSKHLGGQSPLEFGRPRSVIPLVWQVRSDRENVTTIEAQVYVQ